MNSSNCATFSLLLLSITCTSVDFRRLTKNTHNTHCFVCCLSKGTDSITVSTQVLCPTNKSAGLYEKHQLHLCSHRGP